MKKLIELKVNGEIHEVTTDANSTLLDILRENLGLTETKEACDLGECGECTVLMDGNPVHSCLVLAIDAQGKDILTIEGTAKDEKLHSLQQAFVNHGAIQCGFCTPGMIMQSKALLDRNPKPDEDEIKKAISGNLCSCTVYTKVIEAIKFMAEKEA